jgi:hypothetical protein
MNIRVRVRKTDVLVQKREFIPVEHKEITSAEDGQTYKVKVPGTGVEKLRNVDDFPRPINGAGLPGDIVSKYSPEEQEYMLHHIRMANGKDGVAIIDQISQMAIELAEKMAFIDQESPECSQFISLLDELRAKGKALKWKKAVPEKKRSH